MHSFNFSGRLAAAPEFTRHGSTDVCKFTLLSNEYAGKDEATGEAQERTLGIQFTAFNKKADAISKNFLKGDQMNLWNVKIQNNDYTDNAGTKVYGYSFIVDDFEFAAPGPEKRAQLDAKRQG